MAQTAVCNRHHWVDQQLSRWLLRSLDRLQTNELPMTQELIAKMLGGLSIVVWVFAMMVADPSDWPRLWILGAPIILALGLTLQVVVTTRPWYRRTWSVAPAVKDEPTSRAFRDRFLNALDADDYATLRVLSANLRNCTAILPRSVCASLGTPPGQYLRDSGNDPRRVMRLPAFRIVGP